MTPQLDIGDRVRLLFDYDPQTGIFTRRVTRGNMRRGSEAGHLRSDGYVIVAVDRKYILGHHLAVLYMTGEFPTSQWDHKDRNRSNNAWDNLRPASPLLNSANRGVRGDSRCGIKGIRQKGRKWRASISVDGRRASLGYFSSPEEASNAYALAARERFGEFARAS